MSGSAARLTFWLTACWLAGCAEPQSPAPGDALEALRQSLTFHAGFDEGLDAAYARGDRRIYSAPSYRELDQRAPGYWGSVVETAYDEGRVGHALRFRTKHTTALFYNAEHNVAFKPGDWTGTVSFWLRLDPAEDLEPGFCDPIQITDSAYNDSAVWVDFTRENPRQFRLGVFGELTAWNPQGLGPQENPVFESRLVVVERPPFSRDRWTHVAIVFENLGGPGGRAALYLDGRSQGSTAGISEPFAWDLSRATIRLGVNYVGLFDELAIFDRALTPEQIALLNGLEDGAAELWR